MVARNDEQSEIDFTFDLLQMYAASFDREDRDFLDGLRHNWNHAKRTYVSSQGTREEFAIASSKAYLGIRELCRRMDLNGNLPLQLMHLIDNREPPPWPAEGDPLPEPGEPPDYADVPYRRNEFFKDRQNELKELAQKLRDSQTRRVQLSGIPIIGKTEIAVELCYRYARFLNGIHWLDCEPGIEQAIQQAGPAGFTVDETLAKWRDQNQLIILDNIHTRPQKEIEGWLNKIRGARLLVIAHGNMLPSDSTPDSVALAPWAAEYSRELLCQYDKRLEDPNLAESIMRLTAFLGERPFFIHLAGRYLANRPRLNPARLLLGLQRAGVQHQLFAQERELNPTRHPALRDTLVQIWTQMAGLPGAQALYRLAGWCQAGAPIPFEILVRALQPGTGDMPDLEIDDFDIAVDFLARVGLIENRGKDDPITTVALFTSFLDLDEAGRGSPANLIREFINEIERARDETSPKKPGTTRAKAGVLNQLYPHLIALAARLEAEDPETAAVLQNKAGLLLILVAFAPGYKPYRESILKQACARLQKAIATNPAQNLENLANIYQNLAMVMRESGSEAEALNYEQQARVVLQQFYTNSNQPEHKLKLAQLHRRYGEYNDMFAVLLRLVDPAAYAPAGLQDFTLPASILLEGAIECADTLNNRSRCLDAIRLLERVQRFLPLIHGSMQDQARCHRTLGDYYLTVSDRAAASHRNRAKQLGDDFPDIRLQA